MPRMLATLSLAALLAVPSVAQVVEPAPVDQLSARRAQLFERLGDKVALIPSARREASYVEFRQNNRFWYLTGLEVFDAWLLLDGKTDRAELFLTARKIFGDRIEGPMYPDAAAALAISGLHAVREKGELAAAVKAALGDGKELLIPLQPEESGARVADKARPAERGWERDSWERFTPREKAIKAGLEERFEGVKVTDISRYIRELRGTKDAHGIAMMRKSTSISALSLADAMKTSRPGRFEWEVAADFDAGCRRRGAQGPAYYPIVGSGPNSCVIHYWAKRRRLEDGDMIVMDAAGLYSYHTSDITRSFPANGTFSARQREVYQAVLDAQKAAIAVVKPGVTMRTVDRAARELLKERGFGKYFSHFVGHHVGMAVHDPGPNRLAAGHVITVEPGVYIAAEALGVRIEDVVLVTETGHEVLSLEVPREIAEIEALMK